MNRILTICLLLAAMTLRIIAQQEVSLPFTSIDWHEMRIDSILPVYTEVVPLESDHRTHFYTVALLYPEYEALSKREAAVIARYDSLICDTIEVETFVGIERGKGLLDISFVPIRRKGESYEKLISAQIVIQAHASGRHNSRKADNAGDRYAASSRLSSGKWVKVSIQENGLYQFSRATLRSMGFSNPEHVHLYGYGGHILPELIKNGTHHDDMVEVPLYYNDKTDSWMFWGNGLVMWEGDTRVRNCYAREAYYFLTQEEAPASMPRMTASTQTPTQTYNTTRAHTLHEKDEYAYADIGRHLFELENYANSNSHNYTLSATESAGNGKLTVVFTSSSNSSNTATVSVNGSELGSFNVPAIGDYISATSASRQYDLSAMGATNLLNVNIRSQAGKNAHLDYIAYNYDRWLTTNTGYVDFSSDHDGPTKFDITGNNVKVIRTGSVGKPDAIVEGTQTGNVYSIVVNDGTEHFVAFNPSHEFPTPTTVGAVGNQDLHTLSALDMVIIIPASGKLRPEAERLAEAHRQWDNLRTAVIPADQIYNEFSSGTPDPTAIRMFMKMLYDKAENKDDAPRYLLFFGDCAWDNRMLTSAWRNSNPNDFLICYESENSFSDTKSYCMEDYFGLLDDGEGANPIREKSDLGIGRFPVRTLAQAKVMVDKSITFLCNRNAGTWKNLVYFLGDDGDKHEHMKYANYVADNTIANNPEVEVRKVMWDAYTRVSTTQHNTYPEVTKVIQKVMKDGALVVNYSGHAGPNSFSHEYVIYREDFEKAKSTRLPLWAVFACDAVPFDSHNPNIGESAVLNPDGGALAFYGAARTVYASQNYNMNRYFMQYLFSSENGKRNALGDVIRKTKNSIINDGREASYYENKLQYALLGDPALVVGAPLQHVVVDSINGKKANTDIPLRAGERVRLYGHIEQADGNTMSGFNGVVHTRLFDSKEKIVCHNNTQERDSDGNLIEPFTFTDQGTLLYESQDSVRDGQFHMEFIVPIDITFSDKTGRLVFYAIDDAGTTEANGYNESIPLGGMVDNTDFDNEGPQIYAYLNREDFQNGGTVNSTPFFVAHLTDPSGISASGNGIGHDLTLCIDGKGSKTYNINEGYSHEFGDFTRGTVVYSIPALEPGPHSLTFRAWDVLNNTSQTSLDFVVDSDLATNILRLTASQNPASTTTNFMLSYDMPGSECDFIFEVFDFSGRCIWRHDETSSNDSGICVVTWNLCNGMGTKIGAGIYLYRCQVRCGESKWVSETQKIIVRNNK